MKERIKKIIIKILFYVNWIHLQSRLQDFKFGILCFSFGNQPLKSKTFYLFAVQLKLPLYGNAFNLKICLFGQELELSYWKKEWHLFYSRFGYIIKCIPEYKKKEDK